MTADYSKYQVPGQYVYAKGIILALTRFPPSSTDRMKTFNFAEGDVVIAAYPKSGMHVTCTCHVSETVALCTVSGRFRQGFIIAVKTYSEMNHQNAN